MSPWSTLYIYIYIPSGAHGYGCQDALPSPPPPPAQPLSSSSSSNIINKANKREAPDDEQVTHVL